MVSALETFKQYTEAFRALDAHEVARFFHTPALMLTPRGDFAFHGPDDVARVYGQIMADAKQQGYATTVFDRIDEHPFGEGLASIRGAGRWESARGEVLSRFEISYVLKLFDTGWRIALASIQAT